jgi:nucleotide-binding universal stress UspA family protein
LTDAECPVLTTRHAETISRRPIDHREWVCAVSLEEGSKRLLRYVGPAAKALRANLALVHVIPANEPGLPVQLDLDEETQTAERKAAHERIEQLKRNVGSEAPIQIIRGPIKDSLTEAARRFRADVLVIGRSPQSGFEGRLRDLTYAVVRDAPCPMLSV